MSDIDVLRKVPLSLSAFNNSLATQKRPIVRELRRIGDGKVVHDLKLAYFGISVEAQIDPTLAVDLDRVPVFGSRAIPYPYLIDLYLRGESRQVLHLARVHEGTPECLLCLVV
jgi:hypothetical protein